MFQKTGLFLDLYFEKLILSQCKYNALFYRKQSFDKEKNSRGMKASFGRVAVALSLPRHLFYVIYPIDN